MTKRSPGVKSSCTSTPHVIVMVGLPARGKTYISRKLSRYLNWIGVNTRVFNLGEYRSVIVCVVTAHILNNAAFRRKLEGYDKPSHEFFDHSNPEGVKIREKVCDMALIDMFSWIEDKVWIQILIHLLSRQTNNFVLCRVK